MPYTKITVEIAGKEISFESGQVARQANGSVIIRQGETIVLSTACSSEDPLPNIDFLPLRIDYQEKFSSAGKTVSGFIKREGRPTERETLVSRLIDRPIRPMIKEGYYHDTQVLSYVLSYDAQHPADILAINGASAALALSDIPLIKPIGAVRVGLCNDTFIVNPTVEEIKKSTLDLVLAGTEDSVLMIEGYCSFLTEEQIIEAIEKGHSEIKKICHALKNWSEQYGKQKRLDTIVTIPEELKTLVKQLSEPLLLKASSTKEKKAREKILSEGKKSIIQSLSQEGATVQYPATLVKMTIDHISSDYMRDMILKDGIRWDGRGLKEIRPITIEQSFLPRTHGSSLFTRGETQSLAICVLGGEHMAQRYEDLHGEGNQSFYLQYFFPPFSVGEVGRMGAPGRREVGHGKLAERALQATLPSKDLFPYTIRLESNITESNGSSSMASVCGGCLALMDAGVPIKRPVSGIAMGLLIQDKKYVILSDILGVEDALGDMDFKVTGDKEGITAFQMDIKVEGITIEIMKTALQQAKEGRLHILEKMIAACPVMKKEMSIYAPRNEKMQINPSKIGIVIGPGGKQIRAIIEQTGVEINITDDGTVSLSSSSSEKLNEAKNIINGLTAEAEVGKIYKGKITSVVQFGLFLEILPGKEGLCHISELDTSRIEDINDFMKKNNLKQGDSFDVIVLDVNERGQVKLSRRSLLHSKQH
jgi:polyribonucleotide nucleotidyltransferase